MVHNRSPLLVLLFLFLFPYQDFHLILQLSDSSKGEPLAQGSPCWDRGEHRYRWQATMKQLMIGK